MKRMHVHVSVENIETAVKFYSAMFGAQPVKQKHDYAKWLLNEPSLNFAISARGNKVGFDHFGIQVDEDEELAEVRSRIEQADLKPFSEGETTCCYATADKTWVLDPAGIPWEAYKFMADAQVFQELKHNEQSACCAPKAASPAATKKTSCCG